MTNTSLGLAVLSFFAVALRSGCGSSSSSTSQALKQEFLYSLATSGTPPNITFHLLSFTVDPTKGTISQTSTATIEQPTMGIAMRPDAKFLYLSANTPAGNFISMYSLDSQTGIPSPDGGVVLTQICGFGCPPQSGPGVLAINATGTGLYYGSDTFGGGVAEGLGALTIDNAGALAVVQGSPFADSEAPFFLSLAPSGKFLCTEDMNSSTPNGFALVSVSGYSIDPNTGVLAPVAGSPFTPMTRAEAAGFAVHPSGNFLYAAAGDTSNGILAWTVDSATGSLTPMAGSPFQTGSATIGLAFDPQGKFLYAPSRADGILAFSVDPASGALTPISGSPFFAGEFYGDLTVDPIGNLLLASDPINKAGVAFSRDTASGALTGKTSSALAGEVPAWLKMVEAP